MTAIEMMIEPRIRSVGSGQVKRLLPWRKRRMIGPFIFLDLIGPEVLEAGRGVDVDAHPHIGLSTVTYLFEGRMRHRDSTGADQIIEPGAINWMTAGSGVAHTERSVESDRALNLRQHGVQTWVALPSEVSEQEASFTHHGSNDLPSERYGDALVKVMVGSGWSLTSPVPASSELIFAEISVGLNGDSGSIAIDASANERAVLGIAGQLSIDGTTLLTGQMAILEPGSAPTLAGAGRAVVLGGEPLGERLIWWNFVHHDRDRIEQAKHDWMAQRFPLVPGDSEPWVPLPG